MVLGGIPLRNLLKNELGLGRTETAGFIFLFSLPWYFKPFIGYLSDRFPVRGSRRHGYLFYGCILAAIAWLSVIAIPHRYGFLLAIMLVIALAQVTASTAMCGLMVEVAQSANAAGRLAAMREVISSTGFILSALVGGFLASTWFGWTALACALASLAVLPMVWRKGSGTHSATGTLTLAGVKAALASPLIWVAGGMVLLHYLSPGLFTTLFYRQQDILHMTTVQQGWVTALDYAAAAVAAATYGVLCRKLPLRIMLMLGIAASSACTLPVLDYDSQRAAYLVTPVYHFGFALAEVAFLDLITRAAPQGLEALSFALLISFRNFAMFGSDAIGSWLMDHWHWAFSSLVLFSSLTTALAVPLALALPRALVGRRDGA